MTSYNLYESGLITPPKLEQAMAWLVEHGPLHVEPALPSWILKALVNDGRIARVRRSVYLAPTPSGHMLSLPAVATLLAPKGYLSFYGALVLNGLTDQDTTRWGSVTNRRQGSLAAGGHRLDFVPWPRRLPSAEVKTLHRGEETVRVASPAQALCDALEAPRYVPSWPELLHVLRTGLALRKFTTATLRARALAINSPALARRLGLLFEMETGQVDSALLGIAQRSNDWTRLAGLGTRTRVRDARWRLELPRSREDLLAAVRE
jgi:predicted transcriptional regulator of viral defense system